MSSAIQLSYAESGSGDALFLIHAFPMDHTMWDAQVAFLRDRYRVLTPDLPGFGQTPAAPGWRVAAAAAGVLGIADRNALGRFAVAGLSIGVYTAFEIFRLAPQRLTHLILANGRARADTMEERGARTALIERIVSGGVAVVEEAMMGRLLGRDPDPGVVAFVRDTIARSDPEAIVHALEALRERADAASLLPAIRCPALVISGDSDPITTTADCRSLAASIPGARFVEIPRAGHLSNLGNPGAFNRAIESFLDPNSPPGTGGVPERSEGGVVG